MKKNFDIKSYMENKHRKEDSKLFNYFPVDEEQRKHTKEIGMQVFQKFIMNNWDIVSKYTVWNSPEAVMKHFSLADWNHLFYMLKQDNINFNKKKKDEKNEDYEGIFNTFTNDELKTMCEPIMSEVIRYFKEYRKSHPNRTQVLAYSKESVGYEKLIFSLSLRYETAKLDLSHDKPYEEKEKKELEDKLHATKFLLDLLDNPKDKPNLLNFILNHLQYASVTELNKLLEMINKGFISEKVGKKPNNIPIYVFNEFGKLVTKYDNRAQCMEQEGLGRQYLQQLLSGQKRRKKCWYVEMTEEKYNEKAEILEKMIIDKENFVKKMS